MNLKRALLTLIILVAIVGVVGSIYFYGRYNTLKANPNAEAEQQTAAYIAALGKLIELPAGETPSVVTVADKTKLSDQPFFHAAENGDILFAYTEAKEAILYRPSTNKIVQVASINVSDNAPGTTAGTPAPLATDLTIAYYNGSGTSGASTAAEKIVTEKYGGYKTAVLTNAAKSDYASILVVDVSGEHAAEAEAIASLLGGSVDSLPDGETKPDADLLIISGK